MIYVLLWAESLALCVLAVLWAFAFWQRKLYRPLGIITLVLTLLLAVAFTGGQLTLSIVLLDNRVTPNYLFHSITFTLALLGISGVLLRRGFRKDFDDGQNGVQRRIVNWPLAKLGVAALAAFALYLTTMMTIDTTMQMKLANVRLEAGTLAMSEAPTRPAERENAAVVYARAFERIDAVKKTELYKQLEKSRGKQGNDFLAETQNPQLREYLVKLKPALDLVRRAAAMPQCAFERPYATPSFDIALPELGKMRECARLLAADARSRAADGDLKGALQDIRAIQGLAEHMSYEPILISGLVSAACSNIGVDALETVLRSAEPSAADLEALSAEELFSFRRVYIRSLRGEHAFGLSGFAILGDSNGAYTFEMVTLGESGLLSFISRIGLPYWRIYLMPSDLRAYNSTMAAYKRSATEPYSENKKYISRLSDPTQPREGILASMITPALGRSFQIFLSAEARQRLATVARAVSLYRAKNKAFPKDLETLVPDYISEIPNDPFDDKPLRMKTHANGVTLYSIGTDAVDQGGAPPTRNHADDNDIVLRIGKVDDPAAATAPTATDAKPAPALPGPPKTGF